MWRYAYVAGLFIQFTRAVACGVGTHFVGGFIG
ncbi:hypothetical protein Hjap01_03022 [Haloarcula japonica]